MTLAVGNRSHRLRIVELQCSSAKAVKEKPLKYRVKKRGKQSEKHYVWITNANHNATSGSGWWVLVDKSSLFLPSTKASLGKCSVRTEVLLFLKRVTTFQTSHEVKEGLSKYSLNYIQECLQELAQHDLVEKIPKENQNQSIRWKIKEGILV